jgi:hypothetical protein
MPRNRNGRVENNAHARRAEVVACSGWKRRILCDASASTVTLRRAPFARGRRWISSAIRPSNRTGSGRFADPRG